MTPGCTGSHSAGRWTTSLLAAILLGCAGFAGNWFKLPLFLNIDILFGGFFVMTALLRYGTFAGIVASLIASSCTWFMWNHPYAVIIFTAETAIVAILNNRRTKSDLLLHDIIYWLLFGTPLVWIFYHFQLSDSVSATNLIVVKQALNGITNSLLASIFYLVVMSRKKESERPSLQQVVFIIMVSLVLFSTSFHVFRELRTMKFKEEQRLAEQTMRATEMTRSFLNHWLAEHQQVVISLAERIGGQGGKSFREMRQAVDTLKGASTAFLRMEVLDWNAATVVSSSNDELGRSALSVSHSDPVFLKQLREQHKPYVSTVVVDKDAPKIPLVTINVPLVSGDSFTGFCTGIVRIDELHQYLQTIIAGRTMHITVIDQSGQVVVSSRTDLAAMTPYAPPTGGSLRRVATTVDQWIPDPARGKNLNQRWASSFFLTKMEISTDSRWRVIVENAYGPIHAELQHNASSWLFQLLLLSVFIIPFSSFISFRLTRSLGALQRATMSLPHDVQRNLFRELPDSNIQDINGLMVNFKAAALALHTQHQTLSTLNRELEETSRELSRAEERYRTLVEMAPDAVLVLQNDRIVFANRAATGLFGTEAVDQLLGRSITDCIHPADRENFQKRIQRAVAGESLSLLEVRGLKEDGREIVLEYVGVPVIFNEWSAVQVILRDISERKRLEDLIRKGKEEWEHTFDSVPDLIVILDNQYRILRLNRAMAERLGRSLGECIGLTCHEVIHGTDSPPWFCPDSVTMADSHGREIGMDTQMFGDDFLVTTSSLYDQQGEVYASVHMARDISALKQARKIVEKSAAELESIFAAIHDVIVIYDTDMNVTKANQMFVSTYGFDPVGLNIREIVERTCCRWLDGQPYVFDMQEATRTLRGETVRNQHFITTRDNGVETALEISSTPLRLEDDTVSGMVTVWHDITETLRAQKALREKEERYRALVEYAPVAIFINRNNRIEYVNPATLTLFGAVSTSDIVGNSPYEYFHPDFHPTMTERINTLLHGGTVPLIEAKVVQLDGTVRYAEVVASSFIDRQGVAIQVVLHDITQRKDNENEIKQILERLSLAQKSAGAGLWDWDIVTGKLNWSPELHALFGLDHTSTEASTDIWHNVMHADDWASAEQQVKSALENKARIFNEFRIVLPSGGIRWISASGDTIYDADGKPLRMSGICLDVTLRKKAEERLHLLADIAGTLLVADSPQGVIESLCSKALTILDCQVFFNYLLDKETGRLRLNACRGISAEEKARLEWLEYGVAVCDCVAREACRTVVENIADNQDLCNVRMKSLGVKAYVCHPLIMGDEVLGTLSFGSLDRSAFSSDDLSLIKAVTDLVSIAMERECSREKLQMAHDALELQVAARTKDLVRTIDSLHIEMAERLKAEAELRTNERLLIQQSRLAAMGEMISNIAHQWRQPLNTLGLIVQRLPYFYDAGNFDREFLVSSASDAMNLVQHMSATIDDFRDFFRPDKEQIIFNVRKTVCQAISLVNAGFKTQNIELETRIEGDLTINGYPNQFAQVILNILCNARDALVEHAVDKGRIRIDGTWEGERMVLTIRDNAGGIPDDILDRVFDPYFTTKGPDRGTGIGLFMAKSIIEKSMGGRISARNYEGGAEFRIEI